MVNGAQYVVANDVNTKANAMDTSIRAMPPTISTSHIFIVPALLATTVILNELIYFMTVFFNDVSWQRRLRFRH